MTDSKTFVIIGGGLGGAKAAEALRDKGFDGKLVLLADEEYLPYERPPLSKDFLAGKKSLGDFTVHDSEWYRKNKIELRTSTEAVAIDPAAHTVTLSDDTSVRYDKLLLATGSRPRWLTIPGADSTGVHYLRTYDDASNLNTALKEGSSLAIVGAGWIGLEVAASARQRGVDVTVVETAKVPLSASVGDEVGKVFAQLHRDHGVDLRLETEVTEESASFEPDTDRSFIAQSIEEAAAKLSPGARAVFVLHDVEGYTHEEIALELGITSGGSKSQLFKARAKLRKLLAHLIEVKEGNDARLPSKEHEHVAPVS